MIIEGKDKENCYITEDFNKNFTAFHPDIGIVLRHIMALINLQFRRNCRVNWAKLVCKIGEIARQIRPICNEDLNPNLSLDYYFSISY